MSSKVGKKLKKKRVIKNESTPTGTPAMHKDVSVILRNLIHTKMKNAFILGMNPSRQLRNAHSGCKLLLLPNWKAAA